MNVKVKNVIEAAMSAIDNADDMPATAKAMEDANELYLQHEERGLALKVGDKVNWTYRGPAKEGTVQKS